MDVTDVVPGMQNHILLLCPIWEGKVGVGPRRAPPGGAGPCAHVRSRMQPLGLCCARHQSNDIWDKLSSGSGQEGDVCHAAAMCTSRHQGPCYAVQAI